VAATRLADGERGDERAVRRRILLHQALQGFGHPMDGMGWQDIKSLRQLLVGNEDPALRGALEECAYPCMRRQPIVLAQSSVLSAATIDRRRSRWGDIVRRVGQLGREPINLPGGRLVRVRFTPIATKFRGGANDAMCQKATYGPLLWKLQEFVIDRMYLKF
jgi:hypothetical protein